MNYRAINLHIFGFFRSTFGEARMAAVAGGGGDFFSSREVG